ncbi:dihydrolipoyl dehydrogenase [Salinadaptatus halalkaliphilus]|uniref:Dihydrolipoyl dehydrogenase n=1 Tax=Salinadaptatus halalkaliphilus TaxID=2419781 RepID=A0A4S3TPH8_9EURY|nr:dihydrolipoyl dehydrogenase [Salinadaptatus halalkaliphilus]THE66116.1 dihydrolipoyl dehydrogenase [Salinadaptatus halalkaliphilus]
MLAGDSTVDVDVLVIGAGPAGYVAAIRAGQHGLDVTLVEKDAHGGTCLNHGCIPSKALITAADVAHEAGHAEEMGIYADPTVAFDELVGWKDDVVDQLTDGVEQLCKANGVSIREGAAQFVDEHTAEITSSDGGEATETLSFNHAIVATGSRPTTIPNFDPADAPVLDSRQALSLESIPDSLAIVGAGYIGMELASVFAKLGSDVTVIELLDEVLPRYDDDLTQPVRDRANELGIEFQFGTTASTWHDLEDGIRVETEPADAAPSDGTTVDVENVLVAVGREPVTDTLALENAGIEPDDGGFIATDDRARSSVDHIFAVGDVAGEPLLAHAGTAEGQVAADVIAGEPAALDHRAMPSAVFTDPEIATVGMSDADAREAGFDPLVGRFPFAASGRALTAGSADGFVRIVADEDSALVLGGQAVGPEASELIAEIGLAIEMGASLEDVAQTIHAHPTLSEASMEAAEHALGRAIHTTNR